MKASKEEKALLEAMRRAILQLRLLGYKGEKEGLNKFESKLVADLADAIHNIPEALSTGNLDLDFQVNTMLKGFDEKYSSYECIKPYREYLDYLSNGK